MYRSNVPVPYVSYGSSFATFQTVADGYGHLSSIGISQADHDPLNSGPNLTQKQARIVGEYHAGITTELKTGDYYGPGVYCFRVLRPSYYLVRAQMTMTINDPNNKTNADAGIAAMELVPEVYEGEVEMFSPLKIGLPGVNPHNHGLGDLNAYYYQPVNGNTAPQLPTPRNPVDRRVLMHCSHKSLFTFKRGPDNDAPLVSYTVNWQFYRLCDQENFFDWKRADA